MIADALLKRWDKTSRFLTNSLPIDFRLSSFVAAVGTAQRYIFNDISAESGNIK